MDIISASMRDKITAIKAGKKPASRKPYKVKSAEVAPDKPKGKRGRPKLDPAVLAARGAFAANSARQPDTFSGLAKLRSRKRGVKADAEAEFVARVDRNFVAIAEQYARDVIDGAIPAGSFVIKACRRHLDDLIKSIGADYPYRFDADAANTFCRNAEIYPHIKGRWAAKGERIVLSNWQVFILVVSFGWLRKRDGKRRFREMYIEVPRKNGKSTIAAVVGNNMLVSDGEYAAEVYAGATSEKQAWEVFGPARLMMMRAPGIISEYGVEVWAKALVKTEDNSRFWPVIGKPGDGSSPHCAIVDEYHEHQTSDLLDTMVTGMGARDQPMVLIITTAGTNLASPCYDKHIEAQRVLDNTAQNEELFAIIYSLDADDDWTDTELLRKANPNIGISVDEEFLLAQQRQAIQNSAYQNRFKTKHLNVWCAASVAGINIAQWRKCGDPTLKIESFHGETMWASLDLASKVDICSSAKVFKRVIDGENHYYGFVRNYLPEDTIEEASANQQSYRKWVNDGHLIMVDGAEIDFDRVREDLIADASQFQLQEVVYDPWRATQLAHQLQREGAKTVEMGQTAKNMGEAFDEFLTAIKAGRFHHNGDPVLEWMASNIVAKQVVKGLTVPSKDRADQKIDGIVALIMAIARAMVTEIGGWLSDPVMVG
jgi:phage terminase large subunit-like protein